MNALRILVAVALLMAPSAASAQQVRLRLQSGRVSLDVRNVPVRQILNEWARVGGVKIVNADKVQGPPVTLQLTDVPEREALEILLRGAAGYMLGVRAPGAPGGSTFDRILILATSSVTSTATSGAPRMPAGATPQTPRNVPTQADNGQDAPPEPTSTLGGIRRFTPPVIRPPVAAAPPPSDTPQDAGTPAPTAQPATPANPFGVPAGSGLPGAITPPPAPQSQQAPTRR